MDEFKPNSRQIRLMRHAIGLYELEWPQERIQTLKNGIYNAFRNRFCAGDDPNDDWEELFHHGLAAKTYDCGYWYFVSAKGIKFLELTLNVKISMK